MTSIGSEKHNVTCLTVNSRERRTTQQVLSAHQKLNTDLEGKNLALEDLRKGGPESSDQRRSGLNSHFGGPMIFPCKVSCARKQFSTPI